jgi:hypothetical protein
VIFGDAAVCRANDPVVRQRQSQAPATQGPYLHTSVFAGAYVVVWAGFALMATLANWLCTAEDRGRDEDCSPPPRGSQAQLGMRLLQRVTAKRTLGGDEGFWLWRKSLAA